MTQKVFDVENKEDMDLLWSILPTNTNKITGHNDNTTYLFEKEHQCFASLCPDIIRINWHDKTEITRPVNYDDMIGCVVYFYNEPEYKSLGILKREIDGRTFIDELDGFWDYIEPVKKSELKFYEDK